MGSFFSSYSVHQVAADELRDMLVRWLGAKGFELMEGPRLFALDEVHERGVAISRGAAWVTVVYSALAEEERLVYELAKLGRPVLHLWLHDSDVWGYELHQDRRVVAAFSSNPSFFGGSTESAAGPNELAPLCRFSDDPQIEARLRRLQQQRATFKEDVVAAFCALFGLRGAASCYAYTAAGESAHDETDEVELLWFRHHDFDPMAGFHLHRVAPRCGEAEGGVPPNLARHYQKLVELLGEGAARRAWKRAMDGVGGVRARAGDRWAAEGPAEWGEFEDGVDPQDLEQLRRDMEEMRRRARRQLRARRFSTGCVLALLRPLGWVVGALAGVLVRRKMLQPGPKAPPASASPAASASGMREENGWLINDRHRCRVQLGAAATVPEAGSAVFLHEPVFAFKLGDVDVWCTAERPEAVRWILSNWPAGSSIEESNEMAGGRPVKLMVVEGGREGGGRLLAMIQTTEGVYVVQTAEIRELSAEQMTAFRATVLSFQVGD